ncbi:MAG: transcription termination/antitermination protein NusG [Bacteroidia bacterium]|nr:transcription termination/antitermination protein NusG [Bacteroidia bacterium]
MGKSWYVVRAVSGQERKVKQYIDQEIERRKLHELVSQVLIPMEKVFEIRNGKKKVREKLFLPGYILIEAELTGDIIPTIKEIPGVIGFLSGEKHGLDPVPLRQSEVNQILGKVDEMNDKGEVPEDPFIKGEPVKVMAGPFNGFDGVVEEIYDDKKKLKVVVKIFGRNTPIELSFFQVEKIV